jgi:putative addiction module component (TIGR02574 family)
LKTKELIAEISDLPDEQRARIADLILQALNTPDPDIELAWIQEVEERVEEYKKGKVELIPVQEVFKSIREITRK